MHPVLRIPTAERAIPRATLTASQVVRIATEIVKTFSRAEQKCRNVLNQCNDDIAVATAAEDTNRIKHIEDHREEWALKSFYETAIQVLLELIATPSDEAKLAYPQAAPSVQRAATAKKVATDLRQHRDVENPDDNDESDHEWFDRVQTWVMDNATARLPKPPSGLGPEWPAKRIPLPPGTMANIALFSVNTPRQFNWTVGMAKPPLRFQMRSITPVGQLHTFMSSLFAATDGGWSSRYPSATTTTRIDYKPEAKSIISECSAISMLNSHTVDTSRPLAARFWEHTTSFRTSVEYRNLVDGFPGLKQALDDGVFSGEGLSAVQSLMKVPFGYAFITGGPGSGKTTLAMRIVKAVISGPVDLAAFELYEDDKADGTRKDKWTKKFKPEVNLTAKVAWAAPSNKLVDDATRRAHRECPDKIVVRVLPWKVEMRNFTSAEPAQMHLIDTTEAPRAGSASRLLAELTNGYTMTCFEERSPTQVFRSLSEFARTVAEKEGDKWGGYWKAIHEKLHDPDTFVLNKEDHHKIFHKLMERAISLIDVACGTPCALAELANNSCWVPDLIVTDEAARLSEAMSLLLPSKWPRTVGIFIGDTKQFQPLSLAKDQDDFKSVFGPQRAVSLFKRLEDLGRLTFVLRFNHRARMTAAEWAQNDLYAKEMSIVYRHHTPATRAFIDWTFQAFKVRSTTIMIRPWDSREFKIGHTFTNRVNANFVSQLIVQLYRQAGLMNAHDAQKNMTATSDEDKVRVRRASILIITPYAAQKRVYQLVLRLMSDAEIPKTLVEVRTVDESPSHEADIIIIDCVRTTTMGFISDINRMSVMMTRARIGTILIGTTSKMFFPSTPKSLINYMVDRHSLIDHSEFKIKTKWDKMCDKCIQPGHVASQCTFNPKCQTCEGARHATRHCPKSREDAISVYADEPVGADDGIDRDCLARQ
ncbi:MFS monocarboxylate transporter [Fusarium albosuccineum]|uniref:MFS monocarboxylate transporter n=1 Tax=Fusarium albosuccineum TaxID=1237068 RepID=A0A8H4L1M4_9HYPO|nr:MFS monocarboxylate transporter [Fusarium albosuccineum]